MKSQKATMRNGRGREKDHKNTGIILRTRAPETLKQRLCMYAATVDRSEAYVLRQALEAFLDHAERTKAA